MEHDEINKLAVLLSHWIKHNDDHVKEYVKWAETADKHGLQGVADNLKAAAQLILQSNEKFSAAQKEMPISSVEEGHGHNH